MKEGYWDLMKRETLFCLSGVFGDLFYLENGKVVFDAVFANQLSEAEVYAIKEHIVPLGKFFFFSFFLFFPPSSSPLRLSSDASLEDPKLARE
jgi:hypothetical protein